MIDKLATKILNNSGPRMEPGRNVTRREKNEKRIVEKDLLRTISWKGLKEKPIEINYKS